MSLLRKKASDYKNVNFFLSSCPSSFFLSESGFPRFKDFLDYNPEHPLILKIVIQKFLKPPKPLHELSF